MEVGHLRASVVGIGLAMSPNVQLARLARTGSSSLDRQVLVLENTEVARRIARRMARRLPRHVRRDELESAALLGLTEAAARFDPLRGTPFVAFAIPRIRGAILDQLRQDDLLSRRARSRATKISRGAQAIAQEVDSTTMVEDAATSIGETVADPSRVSAQLEWRLVGLDEVRELPSEGDVPLDERVSLLHQLGALAAALEELPKREAKILIHCYEDGMSLHAIGGILGITASRVCQLRTRALKRVRELLTNHVSTARERIESDAGQKAWRRWLP